MHDYFERVDMESLFAHSIYLQKINEDHFDCFLDSIADFGPNELL